MKFLWQFVIISLVILTKDSLSGLLDMVYVPDGNGKWEWVNVNTALGMNFDSQADVQFWLFTRRNPQDGQLLKFHDQKSLSQSFFNKNRPTRIVIHGWLDSLKSDSIQMPKDAYMAAGDFNVIAIDWSAGGRTTNYLLAALRVADVGKTLADQLNFMFQKGFLKSFSNVNIVGHNLGAHIAGYAGKSTMKKINVIFGLDPAGPMFQFNPTTQRLNKGDAQLVVGVRTNADMIGYGFEFLFADMEILPNRGIHQPGCYGLTDLTNFCSHTKSYEYFAESLVSQDFLAVQCKSFEETKFFWCSQTGKNLIFAGENIENAPGIYFFNTNPESPYGLGEDGVQNEMFKI